VGGDERRGDSRGTGVRRAKEKRREAHALQNLADFRKGWSVAKRFGVRALCAAF
jgi:hypothetical protein